MPTFPVSALRKTKGSNHGNCLVNLLTAGAEYILFFT